jgi:hypothetical protein
MVFIAAAPTVVAERHQAAEAVERQQGVEVAAGPVHLAYRVVDARCASHPVAAFPIARRCPGTTMY